MIDTLRQNIDTEIEVLREISNNLRRMDYANPSERKLLEASLNSLKSSLKLINNSTPKLLDEVTIVKKLPGKEKPSEFEKVEFKRTESTVQVVLKKEDREKFLHDLSIGESIVKKIKKKQFIEEEKFEEFKAARGYLKLANKLFLDKAQDLIAKGYLRPLSVELRRANIDILFSGYVAMMFLSALIAFFAALLFAIFLLFFNIHLLGEPSFIEIYKGDLLIRLAKIFWIPFIVPILVFFGLYYYPSTEKDTLAKKIDQELPFAVIHMSAISGSGIPPSEIFKIIGLSKEYYFLRKEIRKVLNQINIYGYDLVTALNNVSKTTPSSRLAELFGGLSTTITSGGNLKEFFEKRAESLLTIYRLDREKYTKVAETFMDMYISIVIAAPMILMIILVIISVTGVAKFGSATQMTALILFVVGFINALFLTFLHLKQPRY